ncbi:MAG: SagB/ThcOx family dehydrogenase, partial [Thermodesulfobacteriota bacterium]|nr:SagB/ThcOx family dehydrogenase [Thermodesulfobacteriota bacterium]
MDAKPIITTGAEYHWKTSYDRDRMDGHFLDWENQPNPFKKYAGIQAIPLMTVSRFPENSLWDLTSQPVNRPDLKTLNRDQISQLLYLTGGITAKSRQAGKDFYYRSVASAGALYPAEMYVGIFDAKNLEPGIYHFGADDFALTPLRSGSFLNEIRRTLSENRHLSASFFLTGIFFRSAWKYRARAFRYVLLDSGHLLENLILALASVELAFTCHYDFNDEKVGRLIGLDGRREVGLVCVNVLGKPLPATQVPVSQDIMAVDPLPAETIAADRVSRREMVYDDILEIYRAGIQEPASDRVQVTMFNNIGVRPTSWVPIEKSNADSEERSYAQSVLYRRSKRNYINQSLSKKKFMRLL